MLMLGSLQKLKKLAQQQDWKMEWDLEKQLLVQQKVILVTDVAQTIRYASDNLAAMNGYTPNEVIGKSPKMFQGADTPANTRKEIREAIIRRIPFRGSIVNYRKDGTPYDCLVEEYPVWSTAGELVNFIAFEKVA
jgi:PAS domain S-box-containing protein